MDKLEIKHLAPYLPYGVKMINTKSGRIIDVRGLRDTVSTFVITALVKRGTNFVDEEYQADLWPLKPLLLPLSELKQETLNNIYATVYHPHMPDYCDCDSVGFNGTHFTYAFEGDVSYDGGYEFEQTTQLLDRQYELLTELFKRHYDYFGLIEKGLALDINTING